MVSRTCVLVRINLGSNHYLTSVHNVANDNTNVVAVIITPGNSMPRSRIGGSTVVGVVVSRKIVAKKIAVEVCGLRMEKSH